MLTIILISIFLISATAFCSASEASIFSVNKIKVQTLAEAGDKRALRLQVVKQHIGNSIGTLTLLNTVFAVGGGIFVGGLIKSLETGSNVEELGGWLGLIQSPDITTKIQGVQEFVIKYYEFIFTFFILLFGEVIPKNAGEKFALPWALTVTPIIQILTFLFRPVLWIFKKISQTLIGASSNIETASEEEIIAMTDLSYENNSIEDDERVIIQNVFTMNDKSAKGIMTPRVQMIALDKDKTLNQQQEEIYSSQHSRLPVYGEDYDDIIGFALLRDVLEAMARDNGNIKPDHDTLLNEIIAVRETTKIDQLLLVFQQKRSHIAIVVNEFGGTSGLVTLEDVLEQLVGEIVDETDTVVDLRTLKNVNQSEMKMAEAE
jgi:CBS domain containing-hemolysin-like protein